MIELEKNNNVYIIHMIAEDNRFNAKFISRLNQLLDEVEKSPEPAALVTTGRGKFYSNGLDLEWMAGEGRNQMRDHITRVHKTLVRMLTFPMITVAAINGHAFAAGAMFALAHDFRVMRSDRGYFCLPEVDIKIPFSKLMDALIRTRLPTRVAHQAMCTGKRFGGDEAVGQQIVDCSVEEDAVLSQSVEMAQNLADKDRTTLTTIKRQMYRHIIDVFENEEAPLEM